MVCVPREPAGAERPPEDREERGMIADCQDVGMLIVVARATGQKTLCGGVAKRPAVRRRIHAAHARNASENKIE